MVFGDDGRHRLAVLVREGVLPMELGLLHQLFGSARSADGTPLYAVTSCGVEAGPVRTDADFTVTVPYGLEALGEADTVLVPASHVLDETQPIPDPPLQIPTSHTPDETQPTADPTLQAPQNTHMRRPPSEPSPDARQGGTQPAPDLPLRREPDPRTAGEADARQGGTQPAPDLPLRREPDPRTAGEADTRQGGTRPAGDPVPQALWDAHVRGARVASVCTGAFVLAAAGLLDGRRATTHWLSCERFAARFPAVRVDPAVLYVDEGPVLTSAGEAAGIDLALHMIRRDHGAAVAGDVARRTVVPPHREGGQAQFIARPVPAPQASSTGAARAWALDRLDRPVALAEMAAQVSMSVRTFTRRFREEAGMSAAAWLTAQRVERARQLLERTDLPVDRIAERSGFGTAASLRAHLRATLGVSPSAYRATFRGPAR